MNKALKYGLITLAVLLVLVALVAGYFMATFNPNDYKGQIIELVKTKQQRNLKLDGEIKLAIFPSIGVKLEKIFLSEYKSEKEFAEIDSAHVSLALWPLLFKQVVVSDVGLNGVKVAVVKYKNGSTNLDDLLAKQEVKEPAATSSGDKPGVAINFDIGGVSITHTTLSYRDESSGAQYALKDLNLTTGRIRSGLAGKINFDTLIQANKPKLDIKVNLQTRLTFDLEKNLYQVEDLDLQIKGAALEINNLLIKATGEASANLSEQEYFAKKLKLSASGVKGKDKFDASLDMPALTFTTDKVSAEKMLLAANLDGEMGKLIAELTLQDLQGNTRAFKTSGIGLDVELKQARQDFKLKLSSPMAGSLDEQQINLSNLVFALNASGDELPNKAITSEMKGSVQVDGERESLQVNLAGGLLQSQVSAKFALKGFSDPAIRFDVNVDQFDADLFLPKKSPAVTSKKEAVPEQPFDLSALQKLNLNGSIRVGALKVANVKSAKLRVDVKANKGLVSLAPLAAELYRGTISGSLELNATKSIPVFTIKQNMTGVQLGPLIKDALDFDIVEGGGNVNVNLITQGNTVTALKKALNGALAFNLAEGAIKGIDLSKLVRGALHLGAEGGVKTLKPGKDDKTAFSELQASFKVSNGVARNNDLLIKAESLRVTGSGEIDIGNDSLDYGVKATLAETIDGKSSSLTVPVHLSGMFSELKYTVDYGAIIADLAKQKLDNKQEEIKSKLKDKVQDKLKDGLKNLFK